MRIKDEGKEEAKRDEIGKKKGKSEVFIRTAKIFIHMMVLFPIFSSHIQKTVENTKND